MTTRQAGVVHVSSGFMRASLATFAIMLGACGSASADEPLDLTLDPDEVERPGPESRVNLETPKPMFEEPGLGDAGWSVRPEVEMDVEAVDDPESVLRALDPELESFGVRLKRTW